ncbi:amidase [Halosegnis sp.]|uniref:amidase n=1 Tax=Halosegnis sp. TaxID=2864959 RepID=UPI0035D51A82
MNLADRPLATVAADLQSGRRDPADYVATCRDHIDTVESDVRAWVDGGKPREQLAAEARALSARHPDPDSRPPLFGVPVGVKDIFHVDGLPTRAGADIPPGEVVGPESEAVARLIRAGALVAGKTVTTEFAYFDPGPTRNPHALGHTPGGSSSGSAAAVAAGMVPLALGSQTAGSVIRPAGFCGVVGYKPTYGRVPLDGVLPVAPSLDHVGLFTQDTSGTRRAAAVLVDEWHEGILPGERPTVGIPNGSYLEQATADGRAAFERAVDALKTAGYDVRRLSLFDDINQLNSHHGRLMAAETAMSHHDWFDRYDEAYAAEMRALVEEGREVPVADLADARRFREQARDRVETRLAEQDVDVVASPAAPGPAPEGLDDTGDPVMNVPWTTTGQPAVALPAGRVDGLPVGLQVTASFGADERLLAWAKELASAVAGAA